MESLERPSPARPRRGWLIGLAMPWIVSTLVAATPAGAAHPPVGTEGFAAGQADPGLAETSPPATPATAILISLAVLALPGVLRGLGSRPGRTLAAAALLSWSAGETAIHSVHHLGQPAEAERCPVLSASQHTPGLDPGPGGPLLERPAAIAIVLHASPVAAAAIVLDDKQARAPPDVPA
jgi:hypothetical protein